MADYTKETVTTQEEASNRAPSRREASGPQTLEYLVYFVFGVLEILLAFV